MATDLTRRSLIGAGLAGLAWPAMVGAAPPRTLKFQLVETAGLRRFGYPVALVTTQLEAGGPFRLTQGGRPVPAQFRVIKNVEGRLAVALDFHASPGPGERVEYVIQSGEGTEPGPEPAKGLTVEHRDGIFRVSNGSSLHYDVADNLLGFLKGVGNSRQSFVKPDSTGLLIRSNDDSPHRIGSGSASGPDSARVTRQGPMAIGLRFISVESLGGERKVGSVVDLTFPSSKSWVEVTWTVDDPQGWAAGLGIDLNLQIDEGRTLVDLGANNTVYAALNGAERIELAAGKAPGVAWEVRKGTESKLTPFAVSVPGSPPAEGWTHVMDKSRCTAAALAEFGRAGRDRIAVEAGGRLTLGREFAAKGTSPAHGPKSLTAWFHFVPMPVQIGAATSPQAMLAPLKVEWGG